MLMRKLIQVLLGAAAIRAVHGRFSAGHWRLTQGGTTSLLETAGRMGFPRRIAPKPAMWRAARPRIPWTIGSSALGPGSYTDIDRDSPP